MSECICGLKYDEFRTGETFASVRQMMVVASDDPATWRYKTRRTILGFWHQLKRELWGYHVAQCHSALERLKSRRDECSNQPPCETALDVF